MFAALGGLVVDRTGEGVWWGWDTQQAAVERQADGGVVAVHLLQVGDDVEGEHGEGEGELDDVGADHHEGRQPLGSLASDFEDVEDERDEVEADVGGFPAVSGRSARRAP
jgi:hypothetical protein